jgi:hypothetical protein
MSAARPQGQPPWPPLTRVGIVDFKKESNLFCFACHTSIQIQDIFKMGLLFNTSFSE